MATPKRKHPPITGIRFTDEDHKIIEALAKKKGGNLASVVREALRTQAAKEQVSYA